jgi:hypothetical protein
VRQVPSFGVSLATPDESPQSSVESDVRKSGAKTGERSAEHYQRVDGESVVDEEAKRSHVPPRFDVQCARKDAEEGLLLEEPHPRGSDLVEGTGRRGGWVSQLVNVLGHNG